ncbi:hypothetical protein [Peptostreptococcus faecalis]|uniref:hypothetical protein n=1 Tax=Peptostreptococcus faecalis TaxID=2045015 RepID=UPI000C7BF514|nr:hypothetical protein [Peptostreptococcus faecalis]
MKLTRPKKTDAYFIDEYNKNLDEIENGINDTTKIKEAIGNLEEIEIEDIEKKTVSAYLSYIWDKLKNIELTDLKITVTTWADEKLDIVLGKLKQSIQLNRDDINKLNMEITGEAELLNANNIEFAKLLGEDIKAIESEVE